MIDRWLGNPGFDWLIGAVVIALTWIGGDRDGLSFMTGLSNEARGELYQTLVGITAGLLGFYIATVAILLGVDVDRPRMKAALAEGRRAEVQTYFFAGIRSVAMTLIGFVVILVLDKTRTTPVWAEPLLVLAVTLVTLRTGRIIWILNTVVTIAARDADESD